MNVAIITLKDIIKITIRLIIFIIGLVVLYVLISNKICISEKVFEASLHSSINSVVPKSLETYNKEKRNLKNEKIVISTLKILKNENLNILAEPEVVEEVIEKVEVKNDEIKPKEEIPILSTPSKTERVSEKNLVEKFTNSYGSVKIKNQSKYKLTEEMLTPNVELANKKNVIIFHTHTCESYTPCDEYPYKMTGNYRTTDGNFSVVRVGDELTKHLEQKGFTVLHNKTLHDYPSYNGSYSRSQATVEKLLKNNDAEIIIDLHRDAVGKGDTYGPSVLVDGKKVAQIMFVIGTDGGGIEHPHWQQNLKFAVKVQQKANEMYPNLFRPILLRNSRYNQHLAKAAVLIEVGATANTLKEAMLSMQCLANVMAEI